MDVSVCADAEARGGSRRRAEAQQRIISPPDGFALRVPPSGENVELSVDRGLSPDGRWKLYAGATDSVSGLYILEQPA